MTAIEEFAFEDCLALKSITIPNSVNSIGENAFYGCSMLGFIAIPLQVKSIGENAFELCSNLTSISVSPENTIYDSRNNCNSIIETSSNTLITGCKNTIIPDSVTKIGYGAFSFCTGLTSITIPKSVKSVGNGAFLGCSGLTSISVSAENTVYDSRDNCNAIIETSSNTLIIGCKNTIIPNSVTNIGSDAFWGCSDLTSITIPDSVESIERGSFVDCDNLEVIICRARKIPKTNGNPFCDVDNATLYVPAESFYNYKRTEPWNEFNRILPLTL